MLKIICYDYEVPIIIDYESPKMDNSELSDRVLDAEMKVGKRHNPNICPACQKPLSFSGYSKEGYCRNKLCYNSTFYEKPTFWERSCEAIFG